jgi:hypothetical protein
VWADERADPGLSENTYKDIFDGAQKVSQRQAINESQSESVLLIAFEALYSLGQLA